MNATTASHYTAPLALTQLTHSPRLQEVHCVLQLGNNMIQKNNYNPNSMNIIWNKPRKQ